MLAIRMDMQWYLVIFVYISLISDDILKYFICLLSIWISYLWSVCSSFLFHFLCSYTIFLLIYRQEFSIYSGYEFVYTHIRKICISIHSLNHSLSKKLLIPREMLVLGINKGYFINCLYVYRKKASVNWKIINS